jgi:3-isopropylmalate dehydrogenase
VAIFVCDYAGLLHRGIAAEMSATSHRCFGQRPKARFAAQESDKQAIQENCGRARRAGGRSDGLKIGILPGDDIGHEVVPESVKVMKAAAARTGLVLEWETWPIGKDGHKAHGHTLPPATEAALRGLDGWIMGPIGHAAYPRNDPTWVMPPIRKKFELFAAIRPSRSYPNVASVHKNVDIVFVRELSEGMLYSETVVAGAGEFRPNDDITIGMRVITRKGASRVAREAFEIARTRPRKKVTAAHKEPVYRLACGMFAEECRKVSRDFPDVEFEEAMIDTISMKLAMAPQPYDVVVTMSQFGDILSDIGAGLVGGLGLAPGLCVGERQAMAQATHGSAPDIAGRNIANPYAMIVSGQMLLAWLGRKHNEPKAVEAAQHIQHAVETVVLQGSHLTPDLGGTLSTQAMGDAIAGVVIQ